LWDFQDLQLQDSLPLHETEVTALAFLSPLPLLLSGDIQGRIFLWKTEMRGAMNSANATVLAVLSLESEYMHNVRNLSLFYDASDADMRRAPKKIIATDFAGAIAFWNVEDVLASLSGPKIEVIKESECRTSDEGYNSTLRYEKNGSYSTCRLNTSNFPTLTIPCSVSWEGHSECILSLTTLSGSNMVATTAADCMLRIWAAEETKVGIREYKEGALFGEIDR
jgi:WD40 repeat protein